MRLVEVAVKADLVADPGAFGAVPGTRGVGQDLAFDKSVDAASFRKRNLFGISEFRIRLVFNDDSLSIDGVLEQTVQRVGLGATLVDAFDKGWRVFVSSSIFLELLDLGSLVDAPFGPLDPEWPFDRYFPVAEVVVFENLALFGLLKGQESLADTLDVLLAKLAILLAEVLAQRPVPGRGVDQLNLATAIVRLAIGQYPYIRRDASVIEKIQR